MITSKLLTVLFIACTLVSCANKEDVKQYAAVETYPDDSLLNTLKDKRAMIVIAHDDDMCAMTGTISALNKKGWEIMVLSFPQNAERDQAHVNACKVILDSVCFFNLSHEQFRNDLDSNETLYRAIPKDRFDVIFNKAPVESELIQRIREFNPSVVLTLDDIIGGYGHPEHVFLSSMVIALATADSIHPEVIYQSVYTPHMTESIMMRHSKRMKEWGYPGDEWENAKRIYQVNGLPTPDVQINIQAEAETKMGYLLSYNERERKTMGFYVPAFEDYTATEYFSIFNREFFRVIKTK